jgi:hypothetical protein
LSYVICIEKGNLFTAPELHEPKLSPLEYKAANVYSFGMILWMLIMQKDPYLSELEGKTNIKGRR